MNRLSFKNKRLKFKTWGRLPSNLETWGTCGIYPNFTKKNRKVSACSRLDLEILLDLDRLYPKISRILPPSHVQATYTFENTGCNGWLGGQGKRIMEPTLKSSSSRLATCQGQKKSFTLAHWAPSQNGLPWVNSGCFYSLSPPRHWNLKSGSQCQYNRKLELDKLEKVDALIWVGWYWSGCLMDEWRRWWEDKLLWLLDTRKQ